MNYYRDNDGNYLGGFDINPPANGIEVPVPPGHARQKWGGSDWLPLVLTPEEQDIEDVRNDPDITALFTKTNSEIDDHFGQQNNLPALAAQVAKIIKYLKL